MLEAFVWGALGASALLVGALIAYLGSPSRMLIALVMALGTGVLIGSVSFELIDEAVKSADVGLVGFFTLDRRGGLHRRGLDHRTSGRRRPQGLRWLAAQGSPLAIVFGSVLDGIPESFVLGLTVLQGGVSVALLCGVLLSNLPEGMSSSAGLRVAGWSRRRVVRMWLLVIVGLGGERGARVRLPRPDARPHRCVRAGVRRGSAAHDGRRHAAARGVRGRRDPHGLARRDRVRGLADARRALSRLLNRYGFLNDCASSTRVRTPKPVPPLAM